MTNLKTANIGFNRYCGPAVLSILTGKSTDECARVISHINRQYEVRGVLLSDLLHACNDLGFDTENKNENGSLFRVITSLSRLPNSIYIITLTGHFVCVEVNDGKIYFCNNHTKKPIPAASSARMMQHVEAVHKVVERKKKVYKTVEVSEKFNFELTRLDIINYLISSHRIKSTDDVYIAFDVAGEDSVTVYVNRIKTEEIEVKDNEQI